MKSCWLLLPMMLCIGKVLAADVAAGENALRLHNYAAAFAEFTSEAESGNRIAQRKLAAMYQLGQDVPVDYPHALAWYEKAAKQGDADSEVAIGRMYEDGLGVPRDYAQALARFERADQMKSPSAALRIAMMYDLGEGMPADHAIAMSWLIKPLKTNYGPAQVYAGNRAYAGKWELRDVGRAIAFFRLAAYENDPEADFNLAKTYWEGEVVPKDIVVAHALAVVACNTAWTRPDITVDPVQLKRDIERQMSPRQLAEALALHDRALRVGQINAIDDRSYALTGKTVAASEDPLLTAAPLAVIEIGVAGEITLDHAPTDEPALKQRLQMFYFQSPRPTIEIVIKGDVRRGAVKNAIDLVSMSIRQAGLYNVSVKTIGG